jgi:hypothetical protein
MKLTAKILGIIDLHQSRINGPAVVDFLSVGRIRFSNNGHSFYVYI